jgi:hypothetical protein
MSLSLSISVRSYNELDDCIRLANSINAAHRNALAIYSFELEVNWFDNSAEQIQSSLISFLSNNLAKCVKLNFISGDNNDFSYWRSTETAILAASSQYVLLLSGHCILPPNTIVEIITKLKSDTYDCIVIPTAINPFHFPAFSEFLYILLFNNKIFLSFLNFAPSRFLASYPFSNSSALYRVESLRDYPIPRIEGNEDSIWLKTYPCNYSILASTAILHSHKPRRRLSLRRRKIRAVLARQSAPIILFRMTTKFISAFFIYPYYLVAYFSNRFSSPNDLFVNWR